MKEEELKKLIEKYYEGTSTDEEEMLLRAYFSGPDNFPGYETEKEIFGFITGSVQVPEPSAAFDEKIGRAVDNASGSSGSARLRQLLVPLLSAAAGLIIVIVSYFFLSGKDELKDTYNDPGIAYAETMKVLVEVSSKLNYGKEVLKPVGRMNEMKVKSLESINRSSTIIERNLKTLVYLKSSDFSKDTIKK
jgi:hypothetical protein